MHHTIALTLTAAATVAFCVSSASADPKPKYKADPWIFIGTAAQCGGTAGSNIVTSAWLGGMGLPDNGTSPNPGTNKKDDQDGLLLNKNGPTPNCSSAGADIKGWKKGDTLSELGFDYRDGTHCGAGAPRFNITTMSNQTFFAGCANGAQTAAPQDPTQWRRVRINNSTPVALFPAGFVFGPGGTQVRSISIVFDEGTDTANLPSDPNGVGLAVIDNIDIGTVLITEGHGIDEPHGHDRHDD